MRLEHEGGLTILSFDRPPRNLFDMRMFAEFLEAIEAIAAESTRGLLIRAEGPVVSGGVDVHTFDGLSPEAAGALALQQSRAIALLETVPAPTVFAAHGLTLTAAFEIALACDLIVATPEAKFGLVEKVVGLTPLMGGTQRLSERVGTGRAREVVMTGELFAAADLEAWGAINRIYAHDEFEHRSHQLAAELAAGPTLAHAMTKHVLRRFREGGVPAADAAVRDDAVMLFDSEDLKRAVAALLETGFATSVTFEGR
jgi:enoyl-CoA hydratase